MFLLRYRNVFQEDRMKNEINAEEYSKDLQELEEVGLSEAKKVGRSQKDVFNAMGMTEGAGNKAKSDGYLLYSTASFLAFARATQSQSVRKFALKEMNIIEADLESLRAENAKLRKELNEHKKVLLKIGRGLKKNLIEYTDFLMKKI